VSLHRADVDLLLLLLRDFDKLAIFLEVFYTSL